jgi:alpha-ketoglutarate-dependent taurine dioxygenase
VTGIGLKRLAARPDALVLEWASGAAGEFSSLWLLDNAPTHRDLQNGQRLVDVADLPAAPRIRSATENVGLIRIEWEEPLEAACFDIAWLESQLESIEVRRPELAVHRWLEGSRLEAADFAWASLDDLRADEGIHSRWLTRLLQEGVAYLRNVPPAEGALIEAMRPIGQIAETNYGLVFDVRSVPQPENLAYSDLGLGLHTDNPYREPVPGFQALHTLISSPDGGDSLFADGFALAEHLRGTDSEAFDLLSRTAVPFHYRSRNAELYAERPLIQLDCDGHVRAVHYNSRSIAPLRLDAHRTSAFYAAYRRFALLLREPRFQLRFHLEDGELVVFDNQRILHGRTAFSSARHARHLQGCYLTRDSVYSNAALLRSAARSRPAVAADAIDPRAGAGTAFAPGAIAQRPRSDSGEPS